MIAVFFIVILSLVNSQEVSVQNESNDQYISRHTILDTIEDISLPDVIFPRLNNSILAFNQTLSSVEQLYQNFMLSLSDSNEIEKRQINKKKDNTLFKNFAQSGFIFYSFNSSQPASLFIHESLILPKNTNSINLVDKEMFDLNHDIAVLKFLVEDIKQRIKAKQRQYRAKIKAAKKLRKEKKNQMDVESFN